MNREPGPEPRGTDAHPVGAPSRLLLEARPWTEVDRRASFGLLVGTAVLPWLLSMSGSGTFIIHLLIGFFTWGIVAQCWNLLMGVSGIYSFGQVALFGVGAFTTGALSQSLGVNPWLSIWAAPLVATALAVLIGILTLRLRGVYVMLLTLAFHQLVRNLATTGPAIMSGGGFGLVSIPRLGLDAIAGPRREMIFYYYLGLGFFALTTFAIFRVLNSPLGVAFKALRDGEEYAVSRGVDPFRVRLFLFAFSAFFTGLAGGFQAHYLGAASTSLFDLGVTVNLLAMIVVGGWGTFWGPMVGTLVLTVLPELLRTFDAYRNLAVGLSLALLAVLAPQGLFPLCVGGLRRLLGPGRRAPP